MARTYIHTNIHEASFMDRHGTFAKGNLFLPCKALSMRRFFTTPACALGPGVAGRTMFGGIRRSGRTVDGETNEMRRSTSSPRHSRLGSRALDIRSPSRFTLETYQTSRVYLIIFSQVSM